MNCSPETAARYTFDNYDNYDKGDPMIKFAILWPAPLDNDEDEVIGETVEVQTQERVQLAYLQGLVGGNIEAITLADGSVMYFNEDGKEMGLRLNGRASTLGYEAGIAPWDCILGPAVVFGPGDDAGGETSITEEMLGHLGVEG